MDSCLSFRDGAAVQPRSTMAGVRCSVENLTAQARLHQSAASLLEVVLMRHCGAPEKVVTCSLHGRWHPTSWLTSTEHLLMPLIAVGMTLEGIQPELAYRGDAAFGLIIRNLPQQPLSAIQAGIGQLSVRTYPSTIHVASDGVVQQFSRVLDASRCSGAACQGHDSRGRRCRVSPEAYLFDGQDKLNSAPSIVGLRVKESEDGIFIVPPSAS